MGAIIDYFQSIQVRGFSWLLLLGLFLFGNGAIMGIVYCYVALVMIVRTYLAHFPRWAKVALTVIYVVLLVIQLTFVTMVVFRSHGKTPLYFLAKALAVGLSLVPLWVERFVTTNNQRVFYLPTVEEVATVSFAELHKNASRLSELFAETVSAKNKVSVAHLQTVLADLPRHRSLRYINHGTLTPAYFAAAQASLADEHLYLAVSNTGSAASELISVFTRKQFNHISLAFERDLATIISYNGGDNVYPPGMNAETLEFFHQKAGASLLVYSLPVTRAQKQFIIDKIAEINREGSAYNMLGLVAKHSYKPNIMFCSQFVYKMLKLAGVAYFDKRDGEVRPTDFIEQDYYKRLKFEYELKF